MKVLLLGAGYSAKRFAGMRPDGVTISGTTRSLDKFDQLANAGITPLLFADSVIGEDLKHALKETTHLVVSIAPDEKGDPALGSLEGLPDAMPRLQWIGYLSTVGVYGDYGGAWIDENSACRPLSRRSRLRVEAEQEWQNYAAIRSVPIALLRLSGIYGPGRNAFVNLQNGTAKRLLKPGQVFNRIHADDIGAALWHLAGERTGGVFNVTDDEPAPPQDVVTYAAKLMDVAPPPEVPFDAAQLSPMARSFYSESKRVSNARLKQTGYIFRYPNYRVALEAMWRNADWKGQQRDARSPIKP